MRSGLSRKKEWMKWPGQAFEAPTFGELVVGAEFIPLPQPGDNAGHGGFKGVKLAFTKTDDVIKEIAPGMPYGIPHGRAQNRLGQSSDFPKSMPVLRIG